MNIESKISTTSLGKASVSEAYPSYSVSEIQTWELKGPETWSATSLVLENHDAKVYAWKTQAWQTQSKGSQHKKASLSETDIESIPKPETSAQNVQVTKKKSDEDFTRPLWSNKVEYILAQVGFSVRLVNLWTLPQLWLHNGGIYLAFYILMLFFVGIPLLFMEMASGQKLRQNNLGVWKLTSPWMTGLGYTSFMVCVVEALYHNMVNCWSLLYLGQSFQFPLPWDKCPLVKNSTEFDAECTRTTSSMYFWYRMALKTSDSIEDFGPLIPNLSMSLFLTFCLIGVIMINGLKSIGKVMYVLVPLTYLFLLCYIIRYSLLEGVSVAFRQLLVFKVPTVYFMHVWFLAGYHVLDGLGLGLGIISSLSSYMPPSNNCLTDAFVVGLINLLTSLIATPIIFSVVSFWAQISINRCSEKSVELLMNLISAGELPPEAKPPENVLQNAATIYNSWFESLPHSLKKMVHSKVSDCNMKDQVLKVKVGSNFAFLAFVEAMSFIPGSAFWSSLFFMMILTIELTYIVGIMQGIITPLQDTFSFFRKHPKLLLVSVSVLMYLCGLFFAQPSGYYFYRLLAGFWIILPTMILLILKNVTIAWVYGVKRLGAEMVTLTGHPIAPICHFLLCFLCPFMLLATFVINIIYIKNNDFIYVTWDSNTSKEVPREYPSWTLSFVVILVVIVILPIPINFVYCLIHRIHFSCITFNMPIVISKSVALRSHLKPTKDAHKEEILQDDKVIDQPVL